MTQLAPILVTGAPRSGTTWVGRMLSMPPSVGYIHEPFNPDGVSSPGIGLDHHAPWYLHIVDDSPSTYRRAIHQAMTYRYRPGAHLRAIRRPKQIGRLLVDYSRFVWMRYRRPRPLVKDPIAIFSAEWLAATFNMQVVITIRHPAAFVESMLRQGWGNDLRSVVAQPRLLETHLAELRGDIEAYVAQPQPLINNAMLQWRMFYHVVAQYEQRHPTWLFLRHEDLSRAPLSTFQWLYAQLELPFTQRVQRRIHDSTSGEKTRPETTTTSAKLDSRANITKWKQRLQAEQIALIRQETEALASRWYTHEDW